MKQPRAFVAGKVLVCLTSRALLSEDLRGTTCTRRYTSTAIFKRRTICGCQSTIFFFIYNLNQQSEFTFYKPMLGLLQCPVGESSSGESPVPQIRSIGQFLLSRLFSSLCFEERVFVGSESSVMFLAVLVDDLMYV
jgi:hypothetical protein